MDKAEFDKKFLTLVNQTDVVITAPNIAYHLDIPIEETQEHLLSLELNGVLSQQNDAEGNTIYNMPNRQAPGTQPAHQLTEGQKQQQAQQRVQNPADLPPAPILSGGKHAPAKGRSINGLIFNILFPGLGSLICGKMIGLAIMGLLLLGLASFFFMPGFTKMLSPIPIVASWIWSIVAGIQLLNDKEGSGKSG